MTTRMRLFAFSCVLALVLGSADGAAAATVFFKGKSDVGKVSFDLHGPAENGFIKYGRAEIEDFYGEGVVIDDVLTCRATAKDFVIRGPVNVQRDGDFRATETFTHDPGGSGEPTIVEFTLKGTFNKKDSDAHGWLRMRLNDCTTGPIEWRASPR